MLEVLLGEVCLPAVEVLQHTHRSIHTVLITEPYVNYFSTTRPHPEYPPHPGYHHIQGATTSRVPFVLPNFLQRGNIWNCTCQGIAAELSQAVLLCIHHFDVQSSLICIPKYGVVYRSVCAQL